jgi:ATP phosphoribosyltransferase
LFAVPKKGRLNQSTLNLLEGADIQFKRENRLDIALVKNLPIALIFLPAADIPTFVGQGQVDLGITGWDQVQEHDIGVRLRGEASPGDAADGNIASQCETVMDLGFGACQLQIQVPKDGIYNSPKDLIGKNIGTSFPNLAQEYFANLELEGAEQTGNKSGNKSARSAAPLRTKFIELSGSVEAACALGVADGIVDLVGKSRQPLDTWH